jgi:hypothetical protein
VLARLRTAFDWPSGPDAGLVPGFSASFDGIVVTYICDDSARSRTDLGENATATALCMQPAGVLHGTFVLCAHVVDSQTGVLSSVSLTRREVLTVAMANRDAGAVGAVTARVHFENQQRAERQQEFKRMNFQTIAM